MALPDSANQDCSISAIFLGHLSISLSFFCQMLACQHLVRLTVLDILSSIVTPRSTGHIPGSYGDLPLIHNRQSFDPPYHAFK